jgi:hypothetical protein
MIQESVISIVFYIVNQIVMLLTVTYVILFCLIS